MSSSNMLYAAATSHQVELRRLADQQRRRPGGATGTSSSSHRLLRAISHARGSRPAQGRAVVQRRFA